MAAEIAVGLQLISLMNYRTERYTLPTQNNIIKVAPRAVALWEKSNAVTAVSTASYSRAAVGKLCRVSSNSQEVAPRWCNSCTKLLQTRQASLVVNRRRRRRRFRIDNEVRCMGAHPPFWPLEPARVKPN